MDMISRNVASDDLDSMGTRNLANEVPHTIADMSSQYWFSIFGCPYEMILAIKDRVRGFTIKLHTSSIPHLERIA